MTPLHSYLFPVADKDGVKLTNTLNPIPIWVWVNMQENPTSQNIIPSILIIKRIVLVLCYEVKKEKSINN